MCYNEIALLDMANKKEEKAWPQNSLIARPYRL